MKYSMHENNSKQILTVELFGEGTISELKDVIFAARTKANCLGYKLLYDFTHFINRVEISDIYNFYRGNLIKRLRKISSDILNIEVAIVGNTEDEELWDFTQTTFYNSGVLIRVFYTKKEAETWLNRSLVTVNNQ